jgi:hypothetical protein
VDQGQHIQWAIVVPESGAIRRVNWQTRMVSSRKCIRVKRALLTLLCGLLPFYIGMAGISVFIETRICKLRQSNLFYRARHAPTYTEPFGWVKVLEIRTLLYLFALMLVSSKKIFAHSGRLAGGLAFEPDSRGPRGLISPWSRIG